MVIGLLYAQKEGMRLATSLKTIQKNANTQLDKEFKEFIKERAVSASERSINTDKIIDRKLKKAENPKENLKNDQFSKTTSPEKKKTSLKSVLERFNKDATQFLLEASPEELKILKKYYNKNLSAERKVDKWLASTNECTDGKDDGKIKITSIIGNVLEGAAKTAVGCVKDLFTNPKKLIGVVGTGLVFFGLSCTTMGAAIMPILGLCTAGKLIFEGTKKIITNTKYALDATNDKEAKDRWEEVGNGGLHVGVGIAVGYASGKETKDLLSGKVETTQPNMKPTIIDKLKSMIKEASEYAKTKRADMKTTQGIKNLIREIFEDPTNLVDDNS